MCFYDKWYDENFDLWISRSALLLTSHPKMVKKLIVISVNGMSVIFGVLLSRLSKQNTGNTSGRKFLFCDSKIYDWLLEISILLELESLKWYFYCSIQTCVAKRTKCDIFVTRCYRKDRLNQKFNDICTLSSTINSIILHYITFYTNLPL